MDPASPLYKIAINHSWGECQEVGLDGPKKNIITFPCRRKKEKRKSRNDSHVFNLAVRRTGLYLGRQITDVRFIFCPSHSVS